MSALEVLLFIVLPIAMTIVVIYFVVGFFAFRTMFFAKNKRVVRRGNASEGSLKDNPLAYTALSEFERAKKLFFTGEVSGSVQDLADFMWAKKPQSVSVQYINDAQQTVNSFAHFYSASDYELRDDYAKSAGVGSGLEKLVAKKNWVILVHGHDGSGLDNYKNAYQFLKRGYNVIALDLKGHGKDKSKTIDYGFSDRLAIKAWAELICALDGHAKIILFGVSMGASACLYSLGESLPKNVEYAVTDSGYVSLYAECKSKVKKHIPILSSTLLANLICLYAKASLSLNLKKISVSDAVKRNQGRVKVLFIHGLRDRLIDVKNAAILYEAAGASANGNILKIYENAGHLESMPLNFEDYFNTIDEFIN